MIELVPWNNSYRLSVPVLRLEKVRLLLATPAILVTSVAATEIKVKSPDGRAVITVGNSGGLNYSMTFDGREIVGKSRFGIIADDVDLGAEV